MNLPPPSQRPASWLDQSVSQRSPLQSTGGRAAVPSWQRDAVLVEHRLDFAHEAEAARRAEPGFDGRGRAARGQGRPVGGHFVLGLVAAAAGDRFAGHADEPTAHQLQRLALLVERLQRERRVGRDAEMRRAVRLDRHGAEDALHVPRTVQAERAVEPAEAASGEVVLDHAELA